MPCSRCPVSRRARTTGSGPSRKEEDMTLARWSGVGALAMILVGVSRASGEGVFVNEVLGGCGESPAAQFVEIGFLASENHWAGCLQLEFRDDRGRLRGTM